MAVILGIDPGSRVTGYGLIQRVKDKSIYIDSGCIRIPSGKISERLKHLFESLKEIISHYQPTQAAIEQVFMYKNASSALVLGHARGAAIVATSLHTIPLAEYSPRQIKQAIVGYGGADKTQVQQMVRYLLNLSGIPQADAADALAVALCHANMQEGLQALLNKTSAGKEKSRRRSMREIVKGD